MNKLDICGYIDTTNQTTIEVFSSIKNSENKLTCNLAIAVAQGFVEKINDSIVKNKKQYLQKALIKEFMFSVNELNQKNCQSIEYKLFIKPFLFFIIPILAFVFDLNAKKIFELKKNGEDYKVGDGILLAGLYLLLERF
jgi:hypothetical protein